MLIKKITSAGFQVKTDGRRLIVKPASKLTDRQRRFIRDHKEQIIAELTDQAANDANDHRLAVRPCRVCGVETLHQRLDGKWRCTRRHPGLSEALARACEDLTITPTEVEAAMSSEDLDAWRAGRITPAELQAFAEALDARLYGASTEPAPSTDPLDVICWTPAGRPIRIRARDEAHAAWLRRMNPKPTRTPSGNA